VHHVEAQVGLPPPQLHESVSTTWGAPTTINPRRWGCPCQLGCLQGAGDLGAAQPSPPTSQVHGGQRDRHRQQVQAALEAATGGRGHHQRSVTACWSVPSHPKTHCWPLVGGEKVSLHGRKRLTPRTCPHTGASQATNRESIQKSICRLDEDLSTLGQVSKLSETLSFPHQVWR